MMTRSGVLVTLTNEAAPSLSDIALALSRAARFAGHTIDPWSVAEHSMVVALIVRGTSLGSALELDGLLHDADEAITGDVPTTWKPALLAEAQEELRARIYRSLGLSLPLPSESALIKRADTAALLAEAKLLAAPGAYEIISQERGTEADHDALFAVGQIKHFHFTQEQAAAHYFAWVKRLLAKWGKQQ